MRRNLQIRPGRHTLACAKDAIVRPGKHIICPTLDARAVLPSEAEAFEMIRQRQAIRRQPAKTQLVLTRAAGNLCDATRW